MNASKISLFLLISSAATISFSTCRQGLPRGRDGYDYHSLLNLHYAYVGDVISIPLGSVEQSENGHFAYLKYDIRNPTEVYNVLGHIDSNSDSDWTNVFVEGKGVIAVYNARAIKPGSIAIEFTYAPNLDDFSCNWGETLRHKSHEECEEHLKTLIQKTTRGYAIYHITVFPFEITDEESKYYNSQFKHQEMYCDAPAQN